MKKRRKSRKGIIRVSKSGVRYRKSSSAKTGWVRVGKKKRKAKKRRKASRARRRTRSRKPRSRARKSHGRKKKSSGAFF